MWISDAIHYPMVRWFNPKISVFDCTDAIIFENPKEQAFHDELRRRIIIDSDVSFFTSKLYFNEACNYSDNCYYLPNGVDVESFTKEHYPKPKELDEIQRPILGFVGTLDSRIDQELVKEILMNNSEVSLVFVGPIIDDLCKLKNEKRIFLLGQKSYSVIPDFINQFDVALIPYRLTENTRYMYPVKMHEYLILGKPVVSTNLPEVRQFSEVIHIAKNRREFLSKIDEVLRANNGHGKKRRIQTALANTWDHRLKMIESELEKVSKEKAEDRFLE
ncbi:MAG: glycosyltransferase [Candidatus Hodarchaeota archaeon]